MQRKILHWHWMRLPSERRGYLWHKTSSVFWWSIMIMQTGHLVFVLFLFSWLPTTTERNFPSGFGTPDVQQCHNIPKNRITILMQTVFLYQYRFFMGFFHHRMPWYVDTPRFSTGWVTVVWKIGVWNRIRWDVRGWIYHTSQSDAWKCGDDNYILFYYIWDIWYLFL